LHATGQAWQVGVADQDVVVDILAGDHFGVVLAKRGELRVARRQRADALGDIHQHVGAVDAQAALARGGDVLLGHDRGQRLLARFLVRFLVGWFRLVLLVALDDDRLETLAAGDRTRAVATRRAVIDVDPTGKAHQVLTGWPNRHAVTSFAVALAQDAQRLVDALAPDVGGVVQRHLTILDIGIDRFLGLALKDQAVETRPLELGCRPAAHVRVGHSAAQR
jgi:hypothetical protein